MPTTRHRRYDDHHVNVDDTAADHDIDDGGSDDGCSDDTSSTACNWVSQQSNRCHGVRSDAGRVGPADAYPPSDHLSFATLKGSEPALMSRPYIGASSSPRLNGARRVVRGRGLLR